MQTEVKATGRRSFMVCTDFFFGTGTMHEVFHSAGTLLTLRDKLKITEKM
jgi:hypothetical protein